MEEVGAADARKSWDDLYVACHASGLEVMFGAGRIAGNLYHDKDREAVASEYFGLVGNCLYALCWLVGSELKFEILCEELAAGGPLPYDHPLLEQHRFQESLVSQALVNRSAAKSTKKN